MCRDNLTVGFEHAGHGLEVAVLTRNRLRSTRNYRRLILPESVVESLRATCERSLRTGSWLNSDAAWEALTCETGLEAERALKIIFYDIATRLESTITSEAESRLSESWLSESWLAESRLHWEPEALLGESLLRESLWAESSNTEGRSSESETWLVVGLLLLIVRIVIWLAAVRVGLLLTTLWIDLLATLWNAVLVVGVFGSLLFILLVSWVSLGRNILLVGWKVLLVARRQGRFLALTLRLRLELLSTAGLVL